LTELEAEYDAAARFYQRNFEQLGRIGEADNFDAGPLVRQGTHRYSSVFDHLSSNPGKVVVEMGYGGRGILELLATFAHEYHIVDIVDRTGALDLPANVHPYQANLDNRFPFDDGQFDCLIALMVIEHMYDPFHAFSEAARVTRPGGDMFINLPNIASLKCRLQLLLGQMPITSSPKWFDNREWDGNHLHYFTVADVRRLGQLNRLNLIDVRPVGRMIPLKAIRPQLFCHEITYHFKKAESQISD
jgi:SAM-dependent methyltransferase